MATTLDVFADPLQRLDSLVTVIHTSISPSKIAIFIDLAFRASKAEAVF